MYKLLLVSDRDEVLNAFAQVQNWESLGFRPPHIRHDYEGAVDSLTKHHADGIAIAVSPSEERKIYQYLQIHYPTLSVFEGGKTPEEVIFYLQELKKLLNRLRADYDSNGVTESSRLMQCRHEFIRRVLHGEVKDAETVYRRMRLLRSKMDVDSPCILYELRQPAMENDRLEGRWDYGTERLESALRFNFGDNFMGMHIFPTVDNADRIYVLVCPLHETEVEKRHAVEEVQPLLTQHLEEGIAHLRAYHGLELKLTAVHTYPGLTAFCKVEKPETTGFEK